MKFLPALVGAVTPLTLSHHMITTDKSSSYTPADVVFQALR